MEFYDPISLSRIWRPRPSPALFILVIMSPISLIPSTCSPRYSDSRKSQRWASPQSPATLCMSSKLWLTWRTDFKIILGKKWNIFYSFLQFKSSLHGIQSSSPLHGGWLGDILEYDLSSSLDLVLHQLHAMLSLLAWSFLEVLGESLQCQVITTEVRGLRYWMLLCKSRYCVSTTIFSYFHNNHGKILNTKYFGQTLNICCWYGTELTMER